jgi:single-strand DNA-binding protein
MNVVVLMGRLGRRPEVKTSKAGSSVVSFSLAVQTRVKDGSEWKTETDWHDCVAFGRLADRLGECDKGDDVLVHGKLRRREWTDKNGEKQRRTEVIADDLKTFAKQAGGGTYESGGAPF